LVNDNNLFFFCLLLKFKKILDKINKLNGNLGDPFDCVINYDLKKSTRAKRKQHCINICQLCPDLNQRCANMTLHVRKHHSNHFEESISKYLPMVDMMTNDDFRETLLLIEHQLIGKEEFVVFLEENLKVSLKE
jgi:hypothetical protein